MVISNFPKRITPFIAAVFLSSPLMLSSVSADDRYGTRKPVVLSPDLAAPWVMQLNRNGAAQHSRSVQRQLNSRQAIIRVQPQKRVKRKYVKKRDAQPVRQANIRPHSVPKPAPKPQISPAFLPQMVDYQTNKKPGSIVIDTSTRHLYLVLGDGKARRYGVGVGKQGFEWTGSEKITRKTEWPSWTPPKSMIAREKKKGRILPNFMEGGPQNPLGARALYLGSTLYRIHGTNQPWSIGQAVSSGCIRMRNQDVVDLYERVKVGATVTVI